MFSKINISFLSRTAILTVLAVVVVAGNVFSQKNYKIHVSDIVREVTAKRLGIPQRVDYTVKWELYEHDTLVPITEVPSYRVYCSENDSTFTHAELRTAESQDFVRFSNKRVSKKYFFKVEGFKENNTVAISDIAWIITGKNPRKVGKSWIRFIPHGRFPLVLFGKENVYNKATAFGKLAFEIIWFSFIAGLVILFGCCKRHLMLIRLFPFKGFPFSLILTFRYDESYRKRIMPKFKFIIEAWKELMRMSTGIVEKGRDVDPDEIRKRCATLWNKDGIPAIEILEEIVRFDPKDPKADEKRQLIKEGLDKYFKELKDRLGGSNVEWEKTGIFESKIEDFPTMRIISAGLVNHKYNGYRWLEASAEVDRAIENRASAELESLRRKSLVDWLWNLGAISPLVGLFGTVTGISAAFGELTELTAEISHLELVRKLAGGIFEALWTTIFGLITGIILMFAYYYFKNKLDWIYSKWEEIYTYVSERL